MKRFEELRNLIGEINKVCETIEKETEAVKDKTEENKEKAYFDFCTELESYRALTTQLDRGIKVETNYTVSNSSHTYKHYINFTPNGSVALYTDNVCTGILALENGDFSSLPTNAEGYKNTLYKIAKNIDWQLFEQKFTEAIEECLTIKAKLANDNNEYAKKCLEGTK